MNVIPADLLIIILIYSEPCKPITTPNALLSYPMHINVKSNPKSHWLHDKKMKDDMTIPNWSEANRPCKSSVYSTPIDDGDGDGSDDDDDDDQHTITLS